MQTNENSLVGKTLQDKYRIDRILPEVSGQGKIYFATDIKSSIAKQYVVKQFAPNYQNQAQLEVAKRLFDREAETLKRLGNHSQIPEIYEYFEEKGQFCLVQQLIKGENLKKEFERQERLTQSETIALIKDVLDVLNFVHQNGCIHRDIKPANLIRNKSDRKIYLIDFGAVKEKIKPENLDEKGNFTLTVGINSSGYTPTEQLRGKPEFCSGIYALGMVAIQALTGMHPRNLREDNSSNPQWLEHLPTSKYNINPNLIKIIDRMVRGQYKERYQSVAEILKDWRDLDNTIFVVNRSNNNPNKNDPTVRDRNIDKNNIVNEKKTSFPLLSVGLGTIGILIAGSILAYNNLFKLKYIAYEDSSYGIELDRPEDWSIREDRDFLKPGIIFISPQENAKDNFREKVKVGAEDLAQTLSLNEYTEQAINEIKAANTIIEQPQNITFANREGRKVIYRGEDGIKRMEVWMVKNKKAYTATYAAQEEKFNKFAKQADKMIESLIVVDD